VLLKGYGADACSFIQHLQFKVFHVFREGDHFVDKLTNLTFTHQEQYKWFDVLSPYISLDVFKEQ